MIMVLSESYTSEEYLLVENRQQCGFDKNLPQGGLAIYHVDEGIVDEGIRGYPGQKGWPANGNHYKGVITSSLS